jgi:hypothetical protein
MRELTWEYQGEIKDGFNILLAQTVYGFEAVFVVCR